MSYEVDGEMMCPGCRVSDIFVAIAHDNRDDCPHCGGKLRHDLPTCCLPDCGATMLLNRRQPYCEQCGLKIAVEHMRDAEQWGGVLATRQAAREVREQERLERLAANAQVYYVRLDEARIKIGYSGRLRSRVTSYRVPHSNLLACEPGGRDVERERHAQFAAERIHSREEFHPSDRLMAWIECVRAEYDVPAWAKKPDTQTVTVRRVGR